MKWYLKINDVELDAREAMKKLEDINNKNWQDYLIISGESGFNILCSLGDLLLDQDYSTKMYQIRDAHGEQPCQYSVSIEEASAYLKGILILWDKVSNTFCCYYNSDEELDYIKNFGLKDPILIKCYGTLIENC
jgi:hypothetical protein